MARKKPARRGFQLATGRRKEPGPAERDTTYDHGPTTAGERSTEMIAENPNRTLIAVFAAAVLALAPAAFAAGPGGGPGPGAGPGPGPFAGAERGGPGHLPLHRLAIALELSEEQVTQAQEIFAAARQAAEPLREAQRQLGGELREALDGAAPDPTTVGELTIELHAGRQQMRALFETAQADFEALLTAAQLERLDALRAARRAGPRGRSGGPGHGPGGWAPPAGGEPAL